MTKNRLEAFSDGVMAIIITIMVLEMKVPHGIEIQSLIPLLPIFLTYVMSFIYMGIYWNNHHHMLHTVKSVNGAILWANLHLLFWLSLIPFVTGWMGENYFARMPTAVYGIVLFLSAISYTILQRAIIKHHGIDSKLKKAIGYDLKGKLSVIFYFFGILSAFYNEWIALFLYSLVAVMWLIPDRRIELRYE